MARNVPAELQILERQPQENPEREPAVTPAPNALGLNEPQEFVAFVDNLFNEEMSKSYTAGAAISVVKDGLQRTLTRAATLFEWLQLFPEDRVSASSALTSFKL